MKKYIFMFCLLMAATAASAQKNIDKVQSFLKECKYYQIATVDGDQPYVRPFGVAEIINGKLYIMTGKSKKVFQQMKKNGKFEICAVKPSGAEWIRIDGVLVIDEDTKTKQEILDRNPGLKGMYSATDNNMALLYIKDGKATVSSFGGADQSFDF